MPRLDAVCSSGSSCQILSKLLYRSSSTTEATIFRIAVCKLHYLIAKVRCSVPLAAVLLCLDNIYHCVLYRPSVLLCREDLTANFDRRRAHNTNNVAMTKVPVNPNNLPIVHLCCDATLVERPALSAEISAGDFGHALDEMI